MYLTGPLETEEGTLVSGAVRDITDRKRAEESLRRSESYLAEAQRLTHQGMNYVVQANIYVKPTYAPYCAGNIIVSAGDRINEPISMVFNKSGEICRGLGYTVEDAQPWAPRPK